MNQLSIIVAVSENNAIGKDNQLLWHLPADLRHFKSITSGHTIIMGRKTYQSIGKPLPNRRNIVISRKANLQIPGVEVVGTINDALALCNTEQEVFIIGGAEIYRQTLPYTHKIYLTRVHRYFDGDTFFPELSTAEWQEVEKIDYLPDEKNTLPYSFSTLERI